MHPAVFRITSAQARDGFEWITKWALRKALCTAGEVRRLRPSHQGQPTGRGLMRSPAGRLPYLRFSEFKGQSARHGNYKRHSELPLSCQDPASSTPHAQGSAPPWGGHLSSFKHVFLHLYPPGSSCWIPPSSSPGEGRYLCLYLHSVHVWPFPRLTSQLRATSSKDLP